MDNASIRIQRNDNPTSTRTRDSHKEGECNTKVSPASARAERTVDQLAGIVAEDNAVETIEFYDHGGLETGEQDSCRAGGATAARIDQGFVRGRTAEAHNEARDEHDAVPHNEVPVPWVADDASVEHREDVWALMPPSIPHRPAQGSTPPC